MWDSFNKQLPIFDNVQEAVKFIESLKTNREFLESLPLYCSPIEQDFDQLAVRDEDEDSFVLTPLELDGAYRKAYYRLLCTDDGHPYLDDYRRYSLKPNIWNTPFLYRGERKEHPTLKANLFREKGKGYFLDDMIRVQETSALIAQHPLVQLLGIKGIELRRKNFKLQCNLYGLAQHYYNKTTEVDFSSSLEVASFFAVTKYEDEVYKPAKLSRKHIGVIYVLPFCKQLAKNRLAGWSISSIGKQYCFERPALQLGFLIDCPRGKDLKSHPRLIAVKFRHVPNKSKEIFEYFGNGDDIAPVDPLTRYWERYRKKQSGSAFEVSDKAIRLNLFMNGKETEESLREKIMKYTDDKGNPSFRLTGREWPEFPSDWLDDYYQDIRNGWWQDEFCYNIFSAEKSVSREMLLSLPSDPRYRYAFYRD